MKAFKIIGFFLFFILAACNFKKPVINHWMEENGKIKILSTTAQIGDLVFEIGGDRIDGAVLIQGELDPHSYELVKGDGEKLDRADAIFYNGLGLEHGASLSTRLRTIPKATAIGEEIQKRSPDRILKKGGAIDPHIWMDISLWMEGIDPVVERLSQVDPEGAAFYQEKGNALALKMEAAHSQIFDRLQSVPSEKRYLVTSHDAFHYFTRSYLANPGELNWADRFAAPEGLAPDGQLNPNDIQKIIDFIHRNAISVLFPESNVSRDSIKKIATAGREMGLEIRICSETLYGDSMSGLTYLEMMKRNADTIARYLE
ncbi:MAG TPA: zinc ABC transporter substrate-binding protein [Chlamydiales bacterium]|nr:zinc ABC transporter substrate-binding protein [Chlamydiales bacterium]